MAEEGLPIPGQHHLMERATNEFRRFIVIFFYLWVVFGLLSIHKSLVLVQRHLDYKEHAFAFINALVFAKVLLVGEHFHLGTRFNDKSLIYPILHKSFVFTVVLICFHIVESTLEGLWHGNTLADCLPPIMGWNLKGLLSVGVMCFVVLLPFFAFREIGRVVGRRELWALILERKGSDPTLMLVQDNRKSSRPNRPWTQ
jgi:hypothetical protein